MPGVYEKENPPGVRVFEQPVNRRNGGVGLARASGHLNECARTVISKRGLEILDGAYLACPEAGRIEFWKFSKSWHEASRHLCATSGMVSGRGKLKTSRERGFGSRPLVNRVSTPVDS